MANENNTSVPLSVSSKEPLFTLNLEANGGVFAPKSIDNALTWVSREINAWQWFVATSEGNHEQRVREYYSRLAQAQSQFIDAKQYEHGNESAFQQRVNAAFEAIKLTYWESPFPHSSTPLYKKLVRYRQDAGVTAAKYFLSVHIPPYDGYAVQPSSIAGWRGLIEGVQDAHKFLAPHKSQLVASEESLNQLRSKYEESLGMQEASIDSLRRSAEKFTSEIADALKANEDKFTAAQKLREEGFSELTNKHTDQIQAIRKAFKEEIALREPVAYWIDKQTQHRKHALWGAWGVVFSMAAAAGGISYLAFNLFGALPPDKPAPNPWQLSLLVVISVFAVWAIRLLVRVFLSHSHLEKDAAERVVMIKTYLSLAEGDRLPEKDHRQLILQAIFRQASDGMVKDEGLPPSILEFLTRKP